MASSYDVLLLPQTRFRYKQIVFRLNECIFEYLKLYSQSLSSIINFVNSSYADSNLMIQTNNDSCGVFSQQCPSNYNKKFIKIYV